MSDDMVSALKLAITNSGQPLLTISKATGVATSTLSEFMAGADIRLSRAAKIATHLGLELRPTKRMVAVTVLEPRTLKRRTMKVTVYDDAPKAPKKRRRNRKHAPARRKRKP